MSPNIASFKDKKNNDISHPFSNRYFHEACWCSNY